MNDSKSLFASKTLWGVAIAALPTYIFDSPYGELPLRNYTSYPAMPAAAAAMCVVTKALTAMPLTKSR